MLTIGNSLNGWLLQTSADSVGQLRYPYARERHHGVGSRSDAGQAIMIIPSIVAVEMIYLGEKGRISVSLVDDLLAKVAQPNQSDRLDELGSPVVLALRQISRDLIPDMPDRIVTATAKAANCALLT